MNYLRSQATAKRLIEANGRDVTLIRKNDYVTDSNKPWRGNDGNNNMEPVDEEVGTIKAVVYPYNDRDIDGNNVRRGDSMMIIAHTSLSPVEDLKDIEFVDDGSRRYRVMNAGKIAPGDTIIAYQFQLRE